MRFHLPTAVVFGPGRVIELGEIVRQRFNASRLLLVTDGGIRKAGIADRVISVLPECQVFDEVEQNPRHPTVEKGGWLARRYEPDLVVGVGGGSVLDAAKAIALLATNPGRIEDYEGREKYKTPPLPVIAVPTTCGTGSEVTWVSVITHTSRKFKMSIKGPLMFPALALVDPDLLITLPPSLVASTGMDALTHAIEAYTVKPATFLTDIFAMEALRLIFRHLENAHRNIKENRESREGMMLASLLAGMAFGQSDVGAVHCLAEAVGALYDIPHGVANAVFLPYVMEFNLKAAEEKYAEIALIARLQGASQEEASLELIQEIKALSSRLAVPSFSDLGIKENEFIEVAQKAFENNSNPSNPREVTAADYLAMLKKANSGS